MTWDVEPRSYPRSCGGLTSISFGGNPISPHVQFGMWRRRSGTSANLPNWKREKGCLKRDQNPILDIFSSMLLQKRTFL